VEEIMGILDGIIIGKIFGGETPGGLFEQVLGLINNPQTGGLSGLVDQFNNKGLGGLVSSWISTGENQGGMLDQGLAFLKKSFFGG
jgi:uncharacterized protein YidB (DUF937 family)